MITLEVPRVFSPSAQAHMLQAQCQNAKLADYPWLGSMSRTVTVPMLVLNEERRVIKANQVLLDMFQLQHESQILGMDLAIKDPQDFKLREEFLQVDGAGYWITTIDDLRDEAKRRTLEKVFLHDILNTAGGVQGLSEVMAEAEPGDMDYLTGTVKHLADQLVDEITAQRDFLSAEHGDLPVDPKPVNAGALAKMVVQRYRNHPVTEDRQMLLVGEDSPVVFRTDPTVLSRVLSNMVKNALEASPDATVITVDFGRKPGLKGPGQVWFSVHNPGFIAEDIQPLVFTRSFSTKGAGRGLGTYGMRLLSERFLGGRVDFESHPTAGTVFTVTLPFDGPCR